MLFITAYILSDWNGTLILINFFEKMEILAIMYKLSRETDFISKLKNGVMWSDKLVFKSLK